MFHGLSAEGAKAGVVGIVDTQTPDDPSFIYILGAHTSIYISFSSKYLHQLQSIWVKKYANEMDLQIFYTLFVFGLNVQVSGENYPNEMGRFHKALLNVKNTYVTL